MTTTSVKGVTTVMNALTANLNSAAVASDVSFQSVWNNQANRNSASEETGKPAEETGKTDYRGESLKAKETVRKQVKETGKADSTEMTQEQTEEAMEVLVTAAGEMMQQVADTFELSEEELQQLMNELDMDNLDILNPEMLSALLLEASGAADSMSLLTDEGLYTDFKKLMDLQQQMLTEAGEELQLPKEQLLQLTDRNVLQEAQNIVNAVSEEIVIEVEAEGNAEESMQADGDEKVSVNQADNQTSDINPAITTRETEGKGQTGNGGEQNTGNSNEQTGNLLLQNLKNQEMQPEVSNVQTSTVRDADTEYIMRQIMDYMKIQIKPGVSDLEMQLHPESLGTLQIHVSSKGGVVTANFITQNETVKAALESQMVQLKESFAEQGVKVEAIEVTVQTHQFERNLDQGRGSNQGEPEKKGRTRRINLNVDALSENPEDMTQEDALAAEIMTANGNTVDYTA